MFSMMDAHYLSVLLLIFKTLHRLFLVSGGFHIPSHLLATWQLTYSRGALFCLLHVASSANKTKYKYCNKLLELFFIFNLLKFGDYK